MNRISGSNIFFMFSITHYFHICKYFQIKSEVFNFTICFCLYIGLEYGGWTYIGPNYFEREIKSYVYQRLENELAICNINLKILPLRDSRNFEFPRDKVIIVPVNLPFYEKLQTRLQKALMKITGKVFHCLQLICSRD